MAKILVVDDEDSLAEMIGMLVEDLGYEALYAYNGREALNCLAHQQTLPNLIISDVMMPQMNGLELVRTLQKHPTYQTIPVILMSAAGAPAEFSQSIAFIHKPFDLDLLGDMIERFLDH